MAYIRLDSHAFFHNLTSITTHLQAHIAEHFPNAKSPELALVLKDNAYGHGLEQMARLARDYGIASVFVKNYDEARRIEGLFDSITILYGEMPHNASNSMWQAIPSLHALHSVIAQESKRTIELKVNIGMHRNGISYDELSNALEALRQAPHIRLGGVFAHNGYGDNADRAFIHSLQLFREIKHKVIAWCKAHNLPLPRFHSLSTTGAVRFYDKLCALDTQALESTPKAIDFVDDLVRVGIGAYGYHTSEMPSSIHALNLRPVASLYAKKIASQTLAIGDRIGYGGASIVRSAGVFSTYDVGYGDGLMRLSGKEGRLYCASGEEILPVMSMDCFSCQSAKDEICVFNDVSEWARVFRTIPYVILTHLSPQLPRVVV